jgi:hypothetical protein
VLNGEEEDDDEELAQEELELIELAAIQEATAAKPVVVPDGKGRGCRFSSGKQYGEVDLRWLQAPVKKGLWGTGGRVEVALPSLAGMQRDDQGDLSEISAKGYELMDDDGRAKIDEMLEAGLKLGSAGVAGAVLAVLQRSSKEGTSLAIDTQGRGPLLRKLSSMKLVKVIRSNKGGGGRSEGPPRATPRQTLCADGKGVFARAIGAAQGQSLSAGTLTVNQNRLAGQVLMGKKSSGAWKKKNGHGQVLSMPRSRANKGREW